jgi:hypothetical protein
MSRSQSVLSQFLVTNPSRFVSDLNSSLFAVLL